MVPRPLPLLPPPSPQRHEVGARARVAELLQLLHAPLADTLLVAERLNVARINIAVAQTDLERQPSKLVDLCVVRRRTAEQDLSTPRTVAGDGFGQVLRGDSGRLEPRMELATE